MSENEVPTKLLEKLNSIMDEIGQIEKTGYNDHFHYDFVEKDVVFDRFREKFSEYDIQPVVNVDSQQIDRYQHQTSNGSKMKAITRCVVKLTLYDVQSGEHLTYTLPGQGMDTQDKGVAKATGLAVKYLLMNNFLIDSGEDDPDRSSGSTSKSSSNADAEKMTNEKGTVTDAQRDAIFGISSDAEIEVDGETLSGKDEIVDHVKQTYGADTLSDLSKQQASKTIDRLMELTEDD